MTEIAGERSQRELDVVLWGGTGFTGRLVAAHLLRRHGVEGDLRWALAGRSQAKLEALRKELADRAGVATDGLPLLLADARDPESLVALARRTRVVCTTVGPYALYGSELVAACAEHGTDYCDLTGELQWMRRMIDAHEDSARRSGARIVHTCGFDCIPSDLGTLFVQQAMQLRHGTAGRHVKLRAYRFAGGFSGGTIASLLNVLEEATRDPAVRRLLADPYALDPEGAGGGPDGADLAGIAYDRDFDAWIAPFVMAAINTRVVRRSHALSGHPWGRDFRYDEATWTGPGPAGMLRALALAGGLGAALGAGAIPPLRRLMSRWLPAPGEGPSEAQREAGFFEVLLHASHPEVPGGLRARVRGDKDPGYGSTAQMLGEAAACLAQDALPAEGGFWTPATAMGSPLIERLRAHAGLTFELDED